MPKACAGGTGERPEQMVIGELPAGAILRAASHRVLFADGAWIYSDRALPPPIPEPSAWSLMLTGLAAVAAAGCRRRRRAPDRSAAPIR